MADTIDEEFEEYDKVLFSKLIEVGSSPVYGMSSDSSKEKIKTIINDLSNHLSSGVSIDRVEKMVYEQARATRSVLDDLLGQILSKLKSYRSAITKSRKKPAKKKKG